MNGRPFESRRVRAIAQVSKARRPGGALRGPALKPPLQLPPNCIDGTAEKVGTVIAIVGATAAAQGDEARMTVAA